jgi:hypothetical protein
MPIDALTQYLQDHLAGSVAALRLMETLADYERGQPLARLDGLESPALGLQGKLALHRALEGVAADEPRLGGYPFAPLQARTVLQHAMVERERLNAAREALRTAAGGPGASGPL